MVPIKYSCVDCSFVVLVLSEMGTFVLLPKLRTASHPHYSSSSTHAEPDATGVHEPNKTGSGLVRVIYFRQPSRESPEVTELMKVTV